MSASLKSQEKFGIIIVGYKERKLKSDTGKGQRNMNFKIAYNTDVGIKKRTNQDGLIIKGAGTDRGEVLLAAVCDGMGGLSKGELASTQVLQAFSDWFEKELPQMLKNDSWENTLFSEWTRLLERENVRLAEYGAQNNISLGTTATVFLIVGKEYFLIHIGDSRIYELTAKVTQLTQDHTVVAREVAAGRLTEEQAQTDARRSVLLQCVGASPAIQPYTRKGTVAENAAYLLCSDGFRHMITEEEILKRLNPKAVRNEEDMNAGLKVLTETIKLRQETDNITSILIHT